MTPLQITSREQAVVAGHEFFFTGEPCINGHIDVRKTNSGKCHSCLKESWERTRRKKGKVPFVQNITKRDAIKRGDTYYFDGKPCPHGHVSKRFTHNGLCCECARKSSALHSKASGFVHQKAWAKENSSRVSAIRKRHRSTEHGKAKAVEYRHIRRARIRGTSGSFTENQIRNLYERQKGRCANCRKKIARDEFHRDHIVPLARGGMNDIRNIQLLCRACNGRKHAKDPIKFAQENGRLL